MSSDVRTNSTSKRVAVVVGATSKWQSDGRNTLLAHGKTIDDGDMPVGARWGVGGAIAQKFAQEGFFVVLTTRKQDNAIPLADAIRKQNGQCMIVELDLVSQDSISGAFATIRREAGDPEVLVYNAGYLEGRDLPPDKELLEYIPVESSIPRSISRAADRSSLPKKSCLRCVRRDTGLFSSATTPARCGGASG